MRPGRLALVLVLAATGCAGRQPAVQLTGTPHALAQLVGDWSGEYIGDGITDPNGSIVFSLQAVGGAARGDVIMRRWGADRVFGRYSPQQSSVWSLGMAQSLTIRIVRASDGSLTGELDRYWDTDCGCEALTRFRGVILDTVIQGAYETRLQGHFIRRTGTWRVVRTGPAPLQRR